MTTCEQNKLNKEYSDAIVSLAKEIELGQRYDKNPDGTVSRKKLRIAKRYRYLIKHLAIGIPCPEKTKLAIIEKLHLNFKE